MQTIWLVIRHEFRTTIRRRSFWVMTVVVPIFLIGFQAYYAIEEQGGLDLGGADEEEAPQLPVVGLIDQSGLIQEMPPGLPEGIFIPFSSEDEARQALDAGDLDQYLVIPADYLASGDVQIYDRQFQLLAEEETSVSPDSPNGWMLRLLLSYNLVGDTQLAGAIFNPTPGNLVNWTQIRPPETEVDEASQATAAVVAQVVPYVFYFILLIGSGYLLQSVTAEKENRTAEMLLLSLSPRRLMIGKLLGLGAVAFIQLAVWLGSGALLLNRGASFLNLGTIDLPPSLIVWASLFLIFGYMLFGSIMAAGGAVAPSAREGGQLTMLLVLPLMPTLMFARAFLNEPHGTMATVLSFFPFSAPSAMVTRLAIADVPVWQPLLSLAGLVATAYAFLLLAARFFQAGNLLSNASFSWRRMATAWRRQ